MAEVDDPQPLLKRESHASDRGVTDSQGQYAVYKTLRFPAEIRTNQLPSKRCRNLWLPNGAISKEEGSTAAKIWQSNLPSILGLVFRQSACFAGFYL